MAEENKPYYPEQGSFVAQNAVNTLLPVGMEASDASLLFVHAHPDDESTVTGATMGFYAERGAEVNLLTLTRGEMGEVIPDELRYLEAWNEACTDHGAGLGAYREKELAQAIKALGVNHHIYLGQGVSAVETAPSIYRDSGMAWGPDGRATANPDASADCLTALDIALEAAGIAATIRELKPDVVVTYDNGGGYGHPDHVRAHEATVAAIESLRGSSVEPEMVWGLEGDVDSDDHRIQAVIDGSLNRKREAMAAHKTQVIITGDETYQFSNLVTQKISARETYRLLGQKEHSTE